MPIAECSARRRRWQALPLLASALLLAPPAASAQSVLARAHAHNDYEHPRPLLDALDHGFNSVEADIHLVDGRLLVAHDPEDVRPDRTLERLYLDPLRERVGGNGGRVHPGSGPFLLLIDLKTDAEATYAALHQVLRRYADILTIFAGEARVEGPVLAVVSGERPRATMRAAPVRFAAYDGRLPDLDASGGVPPGFMPLVSESWERVTKWKGDGPRPEALPLELERLVARAHSQGRRLRFWGTPDREAVWTVLHQAGVDLIGTDDLAALRHFLLRRP